MITIYDNKKITDSSTHDYNPNFQFKYLYFRSIQLNGSTI